jgi:hypothetical protein
MKPDWPQRLSQRLVLLWQRLGLRAGQADRAQ